VCAKEFGHPINLKNHIIKLHEERDLKDKKIKPVLVLGQPIRKPKPLHKMTTLEERKETLLAFSSVKTNKEIQNAVMDVSINCPKLF
jgi:hypothetical protein